MSRVLYYLLLKQVAREEKKTEMAHGNYHWLLFTIYLNTPHDQQQYTLREKKRKLSASAESVKNAFRISAGLLRAVVLRGFWEPVGLSGVGFYSPDSPFKKK